LIHGPHFCGPLGLDGKLFSPPPFLLPQSFSQVPEGTLNYTATDSSRFPQTRSSLPHLWIISITQKTRKRTAQDTEKHSTRQGKERHKTRKKNSTTPRSHNVSELGEGQREKHTGILQTLKTSEKREPKEAEKKMISSFAQVPIFLRPGNIHVPVTFEWSTSSAETTKAANNCCYRLSSCSIHGERDWEAPMPPVATRFGYCSIHRERIWEGLLPQNMSLLQKYCVLLFFSSSALGPIYLSFSQREKDRCLPR